MAVEFQDFSFEVKAEINEKSIAWLHKWANSIASHAKDNCKLDGEAGIELRKSYRAEFDDNKGEALIGTHLEQGYWEEFGTGEHAVREPHRRGWWVYKDGYEGKGGKVLTEAQAKAMAAGDPTVHATNGREPSYTLENADKAKKKRAEAELEKIMKETGE